MEILIDYVGTAPDQHIRLRLIKEGSYPKAKHIVQWTDHGATVMEIKRNDYGEALKVWREERLVSYKEDGLRMVRVSVANGCGLSVGE